jgi:hypothetical protein
VGGARGRRPDFACSKSPADTYTADLPPKIESPTLTLRGVEDRRVSDRLRLEAGELLDDESIPTAV